MQWHLGGELASTHLDEVDAKSPARAPMGARAARGVSRRHELQPGRPGLPRLCLPTARSPQDGIGAFEPPIDPADTAGFDPREHRLTVIRTAFEGVLFLRPKHQTRHADHALWPEALPHLLLDERHGGTAFLLAKRPFAPNRRPTSHPDCVRDLGQFAKDLYGRGAAAHHDDALPAEFLGPVEIDGMELTPGERV